MIRYNTTNLTQLKKKQQKEQYLPCIICKKRRIKPSHRYHLLGRTRIEKVSEGMCKICAWYEVKERCIICQKVLDKGYPQLLAHCITHYVNKEEMYNEDYLIKAMTINFKIATLSHYENNSDVKAAIACNVCDDRFPILDKNSKPLSYPTRWIGHIKEHYFDSKLIEKEWIAKKIVNSNYDSVILDEVDGKYRLLTENESRVYAKALHRMKISEEEITKRKHK